MIDPNYNSDLHNLDDPNSIFLTSHDRINNYDINTFIYEERICDDEYISLIEFCHFISFFNCLSIVMEFTGKQRLYQYRNDNITDYLYITPSDCLNNTSNILYKPIIHKKIVSKNNKDFYKYYFYRLENETFLITNELQQDFFMDTESNKFLYIYALLIERIKLLEEFYRKILIYLNTPPPMNHIINRYDFKLEYKKSNSHIYHLYDVLKIRMTGYYYCQTQILIEDFINSSFSSLETYINRIITQIILDSLKFKYKNDTEEINNNYKSLIFEDSNKLKNIIDNLYLDFNI